MKKSAIITLALSASLLSVCSNTSASSSKTKQVLNWFSAGEISTMDPASRTLTPSSLPKSLSPA
ncbi:hypothetical protein NYF20_01350 [Lactobacillus delbrueckii]|uniref:hypothetical protein n=1 Tax=Lactobacillus delbrueckii TaxID=1584 RepID=UPI0039C0EC87